MVFGVAFEGGGEPLLGVVIVILAWKGRLSHDKVSRRTQRDGYFARQVKKAIQERGAVGRFPSLEMQLESDCLGEIRCRPRNLKGQCIPDGPQVSFQSLIVTPVESLCSVAKVFRTDGRQIVARNRHGPSFWTSGIWACGEWTSLRSGYSLRAVANELSKL